jgi:UDP-glucose 4-epimerase
MNLFKLKVFVTGGAGFIGSHIVEQLVCAGAEVKVYDNFSSGLYDNLRGIKDYVEVVEGDILDKEKLTKEMKGYDVVSHQAAQLEITRCIDNPVYDLEVNTIGTLNILDASVKNGVYKVINASSACTYGQMSGSVKETASQTPNWEYGVSKLAAERYGTIFADTKNIDVVSLRYAIVYGPREWYGRVLTLFLKRLLKGEAPVVFGKGKEVRDFVYVSDAARLHNLCIENDKVKNECFNVSTGLGTSINELAHMVTDIGGPDVIYEDVKPGERSSIVENNRMRLPAELKRMVLHPGKAKKLLGWVAEIPLDYGLISEYEWLQEYPDRWDNMSY